jgi:hypothetical protein
MLSWATVAGAVLMALLSFWLGLYVARVRSNNASQQGLAPGSQAGARAEPVTPVSLWLSLFDSQRPVNIVVADASLVLVQDLTRQLVPLADYSNGNYLLKLAKLKPELALISSRSYTSLADAVLTAQLVQTAAAHNRATIVRYARDLKMRDLQDANFIFLGSAFSNPWIRLFDQERNFIVGVDEAYRWLYFLNRSPQPGEQSRYYTTGEGNRTNDFGLVTYLPNYRHTTKVLILDGTNSVGTEAAGDFITDPYYGVHLAQYLRLPAGNSSFPSFQILLKVTTLNNAPSELRVIAHRVSPNPQPVR